MKRKRDEQPSWLRGARSEIVFPCAVESYARMHACLIELLLPAAAPADLSLERMHEYVNGVGPLPRCPTVLHAAKLAGHKLSKKWKWAMVRSSTKGVAALHATTSYQNFLAAFDAFVAEAIAPLCGDESGIRYQRPPTLRVHLPSRAARYGKGKGTIGVHCDAEYARHEAAEINFWIPFTSVAGSNSLHLESAPRKSDFCAASLDPGEGLRFDGNACRHFTVPNGTSSTRVSIDFRVVPQSLYLNTHDGKFGDYDSAALAGPIVLDDRASAAGGGAGASAAGTAASDGARGAGGAAAQPLVGTAALSGAAEKGACTPLSRRVLRRLVPGASGGPSTRREEEMKGSRSRIRAHA